MSWIENILYYQSALLESLKETGIMMGISLSFGLIFGLFFGILLFLTNPKSVAKNPFTYGVLNLLISVIRSFPFLLFVVALIPLTRIIIGSAFGPFAASFPLSFVAAAIFARMAEQVLLDIPAEVTQLAESLGVSRWQYIWHFLLLEARSGLVLAFTTTSVSMVSYSTVMGIVGGGGIGDFAIRYGYQRYEYGIMYFAIVIMIVGVFLIQICGNGIARKLDKRK